MAPAGNTIGPVISLRFSGPLRISTSCKAKGKAVPVRKIETSGTDG